MSELLEQIKANRMKENAEKERVRREETISWVKEVVGEAFNEAGLAHLRNGCVLTFKDHYPILVEKRDSFDGEYPLFTVLDDRYPPTCDPLNDGGMLFILGIYNAFADALIKASTKEKAVPPWHIFGIPICW